ncbi:hypothetical protein PAMP_010064 [Pampus punctatissimus]
MSCTARSLFFFCCQLEQAALHLHVDARLALLASVHLGTEPAVQLALNEGLCVDKGGWRSVIISSEVHRRNKISPQAIKYDSARSEDKFEKPLIKVKEDSQSILGLCLRCPASHCSTTPRAYTWRQWHLEEEEEEEGEKKATQTNSFATCLQKAMTQNTASRVFLNYPLAEFSHTFILCFPSDPVKLNHRPWRKESRKSLFAAFGGRRKKKRKEKLKFKLEGEEEDKQHRLKDAEKKCRCKSMKLSVSSYRFGALCPAGVAAGSHTERPDGRRTAQPHRDMTQTHRALVVQSSWFGTMFEDSWSRSMWGATWILFFSLLTHSTQAQG